ncbi:MAG: leucine-rich repeat domain-containing protein [Promethearchaeota archaeon]
MNKSSTERDHSDHKIIEALRKRYDGITYYPEYSHLNIINTTIAQLPESIGNLKTLKGLDITNNKITSLPKSIGNLVNLETLTISRNNLKSLPESIGNLIKLETLTIWGNYLTILPDSIGNLSNLETLNAWRNNLKSLPESIGKLENLKKLKAHHNNLTELPPQFQNLEHLEYIDLSSNNLFRLNEGFCSLTALELLNLKKNQLSSLPDSFGGLKSLKHLELHTNRLSSLPESFGNLSNLETINLRNNDLIYLPESFKNLNKLRILDIRYNKLRSFSNIILSDNLNRDQYVFGGPYNSSNNDAYFSGEKIFEGNFSLLLKKKAFNIDSSAEDKAREWLIRVKEDEKDDIYDYNNDDRYEPWRRDDSWEDSNDLKELTDDEKAFSYFNLRFNFSANKGDFYRYYEKSPIILAQQYAKDPKSLTVDERERLAWEGSHREREILEMKVQSNDPILLEINKRLTLEFPNNRGLKLMK